MGRQQTLLNFTAAGPVQKNRRPQKSICASLGPTFEEEEKTIGSDHYCIALGLRRRWSVVGGLA